MLAKFHDILSLLTKNLGARNMWDMIPTYSAGMSTRRVVASKRAKSGGM